MPLRFDFVFSYWIFIWYLLYISKLTIYNPKFAIGLGLLYNTIMFFLMILYCSSIKTIVFFIMINIVIKVIPYYYLMNSIIKLHDVYATVLLFFIFILWLQINNESLTGNLKLVYDSLLRGQNKTPLINLLSKIEVNYKNLEVI